MTSCNICPALAIATYPRALTPHGWSQLRPEFGLDESAPYRRLLGPQLARRLVLPDSFYSRELPAKEVAFAASTKCEGEKRDA